MNRWRSISTALLSQVPAQLPLVEIQQQPKPDGLAGGSDVTLRAQCLPLWRHFLQQPLRSLTWDKLCWEGGWRGESTECWSLVIMVISIRSFNCSKLWLSSDRPSSMRQHCKSLYRNADCSSWVPALTSLWHTDTGTSHQGRRCCNSTRSWWEQFHQQTPSCHNTERA